MSCFCSPPRIGPFIRSVALLGVLSVFLAGTCVAQDPPSFVSRQWTVEDGLPLNSVGDVELGPTGYVWVATYDGLARFDGVDFTVYRTDQFAGLVSNQIRTIQVDDDGMLWLRTDPDKLVRFDPTRETFQSYGSREGLPSDVVKYIEVGASGTLWAGTSRGAVALRDDSVRAVLGAADSLSVQVVKEGNDGTVWMCTERGLWRTREGKGPLQSADGSPPRPPVRRVAREQIQSPTRLHVGPSGTVWVSARRGVFAIEGDNVRRLSPERCGPTGPCPFDGGPDRPVQMREDSTGGLWMRSRAGDYFRYQNQALTAVADGEWGVGAAPVQYDEDGRRWHVTDRRLYRGDRSVFTAKERINAYTFDRGGNVWIGTYRNGLYRLRRSPIMTYGGPEGLPSSNVYSLHAPVPDSETVWVGMLGGGVARLDATTGTVEPLSFPRSSELSVVWTLWRDTTNRLWIGGEGLRYVENGRLQTQGLPAPLYERPEKGPAGPPKGGPSKRVRMFYEDEQGGLWVGSKVGLFRRRSDGTWEDFREVEGAPDALVGVAEQVDNGAIWMGTRGSGLVRYQDGAFASLPSAAGLSSGLVLSIHEGEGGQLWVGTDGGGLCRVDRLGTPTIEDDQVQCLTEEDGLFDDVIHAILPDGHGRLWMSTNRGLFWVGRDQLVATLDGGGETLKSHAYTEADGLRSREGNGGGQPAATRTADGRLWFSTQRGIVTIDPDTLYRNTSSPRVTIEHVAAGDTSYRAYQPPGEALRLRSADRTFEVKYTGFDYSKPETVAFRYRLRGFGNWVAAEGRRRAYFTNVPPGEYLFEVEAINGEGTRSEAPAQLSITVAPFWWETWWFYGLCGLGLVGIVVLGYRWRVRRLRRRQEELTTAVQRRTEEVRRQRNQLEEQADRLKELDQAKSRFFANLSHEFRTPLTLIRGPVRQVRRDLERGRLEPVSESAETEPAQLSIAERNVDRLQRLIDQVLGLARLEAGRYDLNARPTDVDAAVDQLVQEFEPLAERADLDLAVTIDGAADGPATVERDEDKEPLYVDREALDHILSNLLSNAIKYTPAGGRVEVVVRKPAEAIELTVRDTGTGIPEEEQDAIFERFAQVDDTATREQEGAGIGLAFTNDLVTLHGGTIHLDSTEGDGTTVTVRLPRGAEHLSDDQIATPQPTDDSASTEPVDEEEEASPVSAASPSDSQSVPPGTVPGSDGAPASGVPPEPTEDASGDQEGPSKIVLIVDDNADVRRYVRSVLEPEYAVREAADGAEGLEQVRERLPDLILADVMMPTMDGREMTRRLKENPKTEAIPVIMVTARAGTEDEVKGLRVGADDYVTKPFDADVLRQRVGGIFTLQQRLRRRLQDRVEGPDDQRGEPEEKQRPEIERRARSAVREHLTAADFGVADLADALAMSRSSLYRKLTSDADVTPSTLIRQVRIDEAASLLRDGEPATQVAYAVGYESLSAFTSAFKSVRGVSPSAFAAEHRPGQ